MTQYPVPLYIFVILNQIHLKGITSIQHHKLYAFTCFDIVHNSQHPLKVIHLHLIPEQGNTLSIPSHPMEQKTFSPRSLCPQANEFDSLKAYLWLGNCMRSLFLKHNFQIPFSLNFDLDIQPLDWAATQVPIYSICNALIMISFTVHKESGTKYWSGIVIHFT